MTTLLDYTSNYYPDFIVKKTESEIYIIETKGLEDLDVPLKIARLKQWCNDLNVQQRNVKFDFAFVDEANFKVLKPQNFSELINNFNQYKD